MWGNIVNKVKKNSTLKKALIGTGVVVGAVVIATQGAKIVNEGYSAVQQAADKAKMNVNGEKTEQTYQTQVQDQVMATYLGSLNGGTVITFSNGASLKVLHVGAWVWDWIDVKWSKAISLCIRGYVIPDLVNNGAKGNLELDGWANEVRYTKGDFGSAPQNQIVRKWSNFSQGVAVPWCNTHGQQF